MTSTEVKTVVGRPVNGRIPRSRRDNGPQRPIEEFVAWLDTVLAVPGVEAVRWSQSTPTWNDGDVCEFGVGEFYIRIAGDDEEGGDYADGFRDSYDVKRVNLAASEALKSLSWQQTRSFYDALEEAFGDPAEITATTAGFDVEYYDRDY